MNATEFEDAFRLPKSRLLRLGFVDRTAMPFTKVFHSPNGCIVEFCGDRYYEGLSAFLSGPFSSGEALVFPFIADVLDAALAKRIRAATTIPEQASAVIDFLEENLTRVVSDPNSYLPAYRAELARHGYA